MLAAQPQPPGRVRGRQWDLVDPPVSRSPRGATFHPCTMPLGDPYAHAGRLWPAVLVVSTTTTATRRVDGRAKLASVITARQLAIASTPECSDSRAVAGSRQTAGSVAVAGSIATAGSAAVAGSIATAGSVPSPAAWRPPAAWASPAASPPPGARSWRAACSRSSASRCGPAWRRWRACAAGAASPAWRASTASTAWAASVASACEARSGGGASEPEERGCRRRTRRSRSSSLATSWRSPARTRCSSPSTVRPSSTWSSSTRRSATR